MPIFDAFLCMPHQIISLVDGKPSQNVDFVVLFTILSFRSRDADIENGLVDTDGEGEGRAN